MRSVIATELATVEVNGITVGIEHFGDKAAPLVLLAGASTMLSWPDALCEALARGGRHVVRYDQRDSGASTTIDPKRPAYTLRDLAADAAALARELGARPAGRGRPGSVGCRRAACVGFGVARMAEVSRRRRAGHRRDCGLSEAGGVGGVRRRSGDAMGLRAAVGP